MATRKHINRIVTAPVLRRARNDEWTRWQQPVMYPKRYTMFCCDCGLAHQFNFRIHSFSEGDVVQFRVRRADLYTQRHRKNLAKKGKIESLSKGERIYATRDGVFCLTLTNGLRRGGGAKKADKAKNKKFAKARRDKKRGKR